MAMVKLYKVKYGQPAPVEVEADEGSSWPHSDADGETIFRNTHFRKIEDAWTQHLAEHRAGLNLASAKLVQLKAEVDAQQIKCADAGIFYCAVLNKFDEFMASEGRKHG